jgi:hypothetical protein
VDAALHDDEIASLDELDAHLLREERVLEVRRVVHARRKDDHGGRRRAGEVLERLEELACVPVDRANPQLAEDLRKRPLHDLTVLEHVRDAGRATQVVLEDVDLPVAIADEVGADDVTPDPLRRKHPDTRRQEAAGALEDRGGNDARRQDLARAVHVRDERVQRAYPLDEPALDGPPLRRGDHAGKDVERHDLLDAVVAPVDVERDAAREQRALGGHLAIAQVTMSHRRQALHEQRRVGASASVSVERLVVEVAQLVCVQRHDPPIIP